MRKPIAPIHQIQNQPLRERIRSAIRDAILNGDLEPGQALVETELASQLGVSRGPLREALQILNSEGLVETVPYHGSQVRRLTTQDIEELYSMRSMMEAFAVRRIVQQGDPQHVAALRGLYEEMLAAGQRGDLKAINQLDRQFHDTLIELSQHRLLARLWETVAVRVRWVMALLNRRNTDLRQIARNHLPIIEAIAAGSEDRAASLIAQHIANTGELIAEGWASQYADADERGGDAPDEEEEA